MSLSPCSSTPAARRRADHRHSGRSRSCAPRPPPRRRASLAAAEPERRLEVALDHRLAPSSAGRAGPARPPRCSRNSGGSMPSPSASAIVSAAPSITASTQLFATSFRRSPLQPPPTQSSAGRRRRRAAGPLAQLWRPGPRITSCPARGALVPSTGASTKRRRTRGRARCSARSRRPDRAHLQPDEAAVCVLQRRLDGLGDRVGRRWPRSATARRSASVRTRTGTIPSRK